MATPAIYKKNIEITPLQERLLDFFDNDTDLSDRIVSYEWIFEAILFGYQSDLTQKDRSSLGDLNELIKILKGIEQGF